VPGSDVHRVIDAVWQSLFKLGRPVEAREEFERAATLTRNTRERDLLLARAADCRNASATRH
jgi:predicted RNA polymerase sigma factor